MSNASDLERKVRTILILEQSIAISNAVLVKKIWPSALATLESSSLLLPSIIMVLWVRSRRSWRPSATIVAKSKLLRLVPSCHLDSFAQITDATAYSPKISDTRIRSVTESDDLMQFGD